MNILKITLNNGNVINGGEFNTAIDVYDRFVKCSKDFSNLFVTANKTFVPLTSIQYANLVENENEVEQFRITAQDIRNTNNKSAVLFRTELDSIDKAIEDAAKIEKTCVEWKLSGDEINSEWIQQSLRRRGFTVIDVALERERKEHQGLPMEDLDKTTADIIVQWR